MKAGVIVQARMGSTRLPGKVMLPLACEHVLTHVVRRCRQAEETSEVIVATSVEDPDEIVARHGDRVGAATFRGSETDVLERMYGAAEEYDLDVIVRVTADCPLVAPSVIDAVVRSVRDGATYASNTIDRTFPRGLDVEAFTFDSFDEVRSLATKPHHREHVTPFYRENPDGFELRTVRSRDVFDSLALHDRTDLRLTLDEVDDYELLSAVYEGVSFNDVLPLPDAIGYIDDNGLARLNDQVRQKEVADETGR